MDWIKEVKERSDIVKVADYYGLKINRLYKCLCPFHTEKTASFSISPQKQIWKCFGCNKSGDVISLVSELLNINSLEAAKNINYILGLGLDMNKPNSYLEINRYKEKQKVQEAFKKWELQTFILLTDYLRLLLRWMDLKNPDNDLYVEALQNIDYIEYIVDEVFIYGTNEDKINFWKNEKKFINKIKNKLSTLKI